MSIPWKSVGGYNRTPIGNYARFPYLVGGTGIGISGGGITGPTGPSGGPIGPTGPSGPAFITDSNTNATFFPVFVAGAGTQPLLADITTTPISLNPSNGNFNVVDTMKITQDAVAIGKFAGQTNQGAQSVAIGIVAGNANQRANAVAIGNAAGSGNQEENAVAIGISAGQVTQRTNAVAIGNLAGTTNQQQGAVAIGNGAGSNLQGTSAVAIGQNAGIHQDSGAVAIGGNAGQGTVSRQGGNAIAIGLNAGVNSQIAGSICLNASGVALNPAAAGFFVRPIRGIPLGIGANLLYYNPVTAEIFYSTN